MASQSVGHKARSFAQKEITSCLGPILSPQDRKGKAERYKCQASCDSSRFDFCSSAIGCCLQQAFQRQITKEMDCTDVSSDNKPLTKDDNIKRPALGLVTSWVKDAWDDIPQEMVKKSFLKTGISNNLDGSEDDILWDDEDHKEESEEEGDELIPPSWDTDEDIPERQLEKLFDDSENEDEFHGFKFYVVVCLCQENRI